MIGLLKLCTFAFGFICLLAAFGAFVCSWLALDKHSSREFSDRCVECIFSCAMVAYYMFFATIITGAVWCCIEVAAINQWWPIA